MPSWSASASFYSLVYRSSDLYLAITHHLDLDLNSIAVYAACIYTFIKEGNYDFSTRGDHGIQKAARVNQRKKK